MDAAALENEAQSAIAGASTLAELDEARVRYLGRKSALKLALREVRDRETGTTLNAVREQLEAAVAERQARLERAELDRAIAEERIDVTLPGTPRPRGHLHLVTQVRREVEDIFLGMGYEVVDGLAVDRGITLADLKGTLRTLLRALFGADREAKFITNFFPFTEPSVEVLVSCFQCDGTGCSMCRQSGWIEIGGSGMVDPNVLRFVGYDPEEVSGFAFGWGLERMAILRHGLPDIRDLWANDLRFARQF